MKQLAIKSWFFFVSLFMGAMAHAAAPDFSSLTSDIDFSTVVVGVLAVAGAIATVIVAVKGCQLILGALKRAG